ncbi:hypothetical protein M0811_03286 [Anaeramoeba ignava]|uniref:Uncharacterized protein n=1 Tax=Anaeramoeba ignava TaxID=1746090 RepID=A0A9Q0R4F4_ANAIG|nr:hypothetical protein M0811_03286 [Anaeramoeba ignava]
MHMQNINWSIFIIFKRNIEKSRLIIKWKQTNPQLSFVLAYDGRWSSRRNAQEGTVSFICKEGPNSLIDKLILSMTQRKKTHEESPIRSHFFEGSQDFKLGSFILENIMKIMNSENHQVEELFDPNHWFKNFLTPF